jgi:imidazolonepropionase-like amidohydrolase
MTTIQTSRLARLGAGFVAAAIGAFALAAQVPADPPTSGSPLAPPPNGPRQAQPMRFALTGATLHAAPGETVEDATIWIDGGRIRRVASGEEAGGAELAGWRVYDYAGRHIYAGFIDAFVEVEAPAPAADEPGRHWNDAVTPQRRALDGAGVDATTGEALRKLGFAAAGISPSAGIFRGSTAVVSLAEAPGDASQGRPPVYADGVFHQLSLDTSRGGYPSSQMGTIALIRQTLIDADWQRKVGGAGADTEYSALEALYDTQRPLLFDVRNELEVVRAAKIAREMQRPVAIVGSGSEFQRLDALKRERETLGGSANGGGGANGAGGLDELPLIVPLAFPEAPDVSSVGKAESTDLGTMLRWEQAPTNPRRLREAGFDVSLTTSKAPSSAGGRGGFLKNLRKAIEHGLSEDDALAMITTAPAAMLGVEDHLGTVEAGKVASLVVVDGPIFGKDAKILDVWIDGRRHEINRPDDPSIAGTWDATLAGRFELVLEVSGRNQVTIKEPGEEEAAPEEGAGEEADEPDDGEAEEGADDDEADEQPDEEADEGADEGAEDAQEEEGDKPKAKSVKAKEVERDRDSITVIFDHEPFGMPGMFTLSGLIDGDRIRGAGARSDGHVFEWSATRRAADEKKDEKKKDDDKPDVPADLPGYPFGPYAVRELPEQRPVIFTNAIVWTSGPEGVIENGWVFIKDGKVSAVGRGGPPGTAGDVTVIDCEGRHITPGLIDAHSHTGTWTGGTNEGGQAVTSEVRMGDTSDPDAINWYRQLAGGITTVNTLHGSANPIGGQNVLQKVRWGVRHPDDMHMEDYKPGIKFALGENVKRSRSPNNTRYPTSRMGVETLIRDRFTAAREYDGSWRRWASAPGDGALAGIAAGAIGGGLNITESAGDIAAMPRRDLELEALAEILRGERLVHCHSYRQDEILMLCRVAEDFGFTIGSFQHGLECYKVAEAVREHALGASIFSDWWAYKVEVQDAIPYAGPILWEAGVVVSFNSDSDELARRMNHEAAKAVKYGNVPPDEALKFVTINPAIQLGVADRIGSLEAGKDADLVIWSTDPLDTTTRPEAVYIDGREYFSLERDAKHREWIAAERQRLVQKLLGSKKDGEDGDDASPRGRGGRSGFRRPTDELAEDDARLPRGWWFTRDETSGVVPASAVCGGCGVLHELEALR